MVHLGAGGADDLQQQHATLVDPTVDSVVGTVGAEEISVLRQPSQCIPLPAHLPALLYGSQIAGRLDSVGLFVRLCQAHGGSVL